MLPFFSKIESREYPRLWLLLFFRLSILRRLFFEFPQVVVQSIETFLPKAPIVFHPSRQFLQRTGLKPARPPLRLAPASDQPGALQHLKVFGNRRHAHLERFAQLRDRGFPQRQPRQNRPPSGIGQGSEGYAQSVVYVWF